MQQQNTHRNLLSLVGAALSVCLMSSCATSKSGTANMVGGDAKIISDQPGEVSLRADRSDLDQARKDIPDDVKKQNDEIAMLMSYVVRDTEEDPSRLRDRFSTALRKKREAVDKQVRRAREDFSKKEKADREEFLKKSKRERDQYLASGRKRTSEDRQRFFADQEDVRKSFFADQSEKRKDFESRVTDERKAHEDFVREKQAAFNQELRAYQTRFTERKRQTDVKKQMEQKSRDMERAGKSVQPVTPVAPAQVGSGDGAANIFATGAAAASAPSASDSASKDPLAEFDKIPPGPATPLSPGKSGP